MRGSVIEVVKEIPAAKQTRRSFLKRATLAAGTAALGLAGYSGFVEPNEVDLRKIELSIRGLPADFEGFKIALISDLHFGPYTGAREIGAAVRKANGLNADVVAILGDFVTEPTLRSRSPGARNAEPCAQVLSGLNSRVGRFAVLGNHDYATNPELVAAAMTSHGIPVLRNRSHAIEQDGARIWLVGVDDVTFHAAKLEQSLQNVPENETKILLVHEPDFADYASRFGIAAQFSGHSHGGQIRIPGIRPLWLPEGAQRYYDGYYRVRDLQLFTNRGIGTVGLPFRFLCPPEVTLVSLRPA